MQIMFTNIKLVGGMQIISKGAGRVHEELKNF